MSLFSKYLDFSGVGSLVNGGQPYTQAGNQYTAGAEQADNQQNPFYKAGTQATGDYQDWLTSQKDPSAYINDQMKNYKESDYAKDEQDQAIRAGQNAGSANGLTGSTPMAQQMQQNATNIASQDQNQWLQNVLGINTQYGQGENNLMQGGQHSADQLSQIYQDLGTQLAGTKYGAEAGHNQDIQNIIAMLTKALSGGGGGNASVGM